LGWKFDWSFDQNKDRSVEGRRYKGRLEAHDEEGVVVAT
jgi:hypothetical protein